MVGVLNHFAKFDGLELFLFLDGLGNDLLGKFGHVVNRFYSVCHGAFIRCAFGVGHLDGQGFRAVPVLGRRSNGHHLLRVHIDLQLAVSADGPLELVGGVIQVFDELAQFDRLEILLFLDGLFRNILHDRRIVDGLDGELHGRRSLAALGVGSREGQGFRTVPEFVRSLEGNFASLGVDVHLDVLVASHFELELGQVVVGIADKFVENDRRELALFFDGLVRNLLEHGHIVDGLHRELGVLLDRSAFRVSTNERDGCRTVPVLVRNFDGGHVVFVDVHLQGSRFRFLAVVLHVCFPGEFGILVVGILHEFVQLDLAEGLLLFDGLAFDVLDELGLVIDGVNRKGGFGFCACLFGVADLELGGFRAVPILVGNGDSRLLAVNRYLQVLSAGNCPLQFLELVVQVLDQNAQVNRLEFLLFFDSLFGNVLHELRRIVDGLDCELGTGVDGRTSGVGRRPGDGLGTVPQFVGSRNCGRAGLVDLHLQVLVARGCPLDGGNIVIHIGNEIGQGNLFEFILFFDGLVGNLLEHRSVVDGLHRKGCRLGIAGVFAVGGRKLDLGRTVPVGIGNQDGGDSVVVDLHVQVAFSLILAHRLDVRFPKNLVLRVVRIFDEIIELDLGELLTLVDGLVGNGLHYRRVVYGLDGEVHRLGTDSSFGVGCRESNVFRTIPVLVRNRDCGYTVAGNSHLQALVTGYGPLDLCRLVHVVGHVLVKLNRRELSALLNGFTGNPVHGRSVVFYSCRISSGFLCNNHRGKNARRSKQSCNRPIFTFHRCSPIIPSAECFP